MPRRVSRRAFLGAMSLGAVGGVSGCLRLTTSSSATATDRPTEAIESTGTADATGTAVSSVLGGDADWTIDEYGSDIVTFDGTFYLSTWVSRRLLALAPDGTVEWEIEQLGKFKRNSLSVTESMIVGCGYGGQVTAVDRTDGTTLWNFTAGRYDSWSTKPLVTDEYVVGVNWGDTAETDDEYLVYVLDRGSGEVVDTIEYTGLDSPVSSIGMIDGYLYVTSFNFLDLYALDTRAEVASYDKYLYSTSYVHDGDLFVATSTNVYRYRLTDSAHSQRWGTSLRGSVGDLVFTPDGLIANGEAGLFKVSYDGEQQWWGEMDAYTDRPAVVGDYVFGLDRYHQLRAFDRDSGDRIDEATLPSEGLPLAPIASLDRTLLVGLKPLLAYEIR